MLCGKLMPQLGHFFLGGGGLLTVGEAGNRGRRATNCHISEVRRSKEFYMSLMSGNWQLSRSLCDICETWHKELYICSPASLLLSSDSWIDFSFIIGILMKVYPMLPKNST